jgi:nucleotide-binding universal stress UspA family protein
MSCSARRRESGRRDGIRIATNGSMARTIRILHPSDFSSASNRALTTAIAMARATGGALTIVHVNVPIVPLVPEQYLDTPTWERVNAQARRWGNARLTRVATRARKRGLTVKTLLLEGDPSRHIIGAARRMHADYVVMGTHGRTGFSKFLLGSVAERVIAGAACPVVTVRGR